MDEGSRGDLSSRVNDKLLSPASSARKNLSRRLEKRNFKQKLLRLQFKLKRAKEEQMVAINDTNTLSFLQKAFEHTTAPKKRKELKKIIIKAMLSKESPLKKENHDIPQRGCITR